MVPQDLERVIIKLINQASETECKTKDSLSEIFGKYPSFFVHDVVEILEEEFQINLNIELDIYESDIRTEIGGRISFRPKGNPIFVGTFMGDMMERIESQEFDYYNASVADFADFVKKKIENKDII
jgi:hypothetical protein